MPGRRQGHPGRAQDALSCQELRTGHNHRAHETPARSMNPDV